MKSALVIIMLISGMCIPAGGFAQSRQQQKTDSVFRLIINYSKTHDADAIYNLADSDYKKSISQARFRDFLFRGLFSNPIKRDSLVSFVNNLIATYKIELGDAKMQLTLGLDDDNKFNYFGLGPYKVVATNKSTRAASNNPLKSATDKIVDSIARRYIQKITTVGLSIGVIKGGIISTYNYGETKKGSGQLPTPATIYEVGSISKTFTATLLAWFVNEDKVSLSDPITKYLPDSVAANPALKGITLVNLSNHTSGLNGLPSNFESQKNYQESNPYKNYTRDQLFTYLKTCTLRSEPGKKYAYSNLAVGLLGIILERVSGKPYEQLVTEIICKPLGLKSTVQHISPLLAARFAPVYDENAVETSAWDFDALAACGSIRSDITDLLLYAKANMVPANTKLYKAFELTHQITLHTEPQVGLGWHIIKADGVSYYFHNGGTGGSRSFLAYNAEKGLIVILLSNADVSTDGVGVEILKKLQ
ncbi:serine hydrolase [Mucilaginibacter sp. UR6-11]|uniref:serine hydrolase domain-containing protein n=1 Tax=Mucilaginibacter sp. UR6-11 TaxID=1435644 RepID=UPI001E65265E|nr:serine hydrolase domain-containing protein [Mucilaginibacter sp. UR6-11]MCC8423803.1 beta-lactamase family protein [Mucilaginibacter sp. UR6-11]